MWRKLSIGLLLVAALFGIVTRIISSTAKPPETHYKANFSLSDIDLKVGDKSGNATFIGMTPNLKTALLFTVEACAAPITVVPEFVYEDSESEIDDLKYLDAESEARDIYEGKISDHFSHMGRITAVIKMHIKNLLLMQSQTIDQQAVLRIYAKKTCKIDTETILAMAKTALSVMEKLKE
ncbi:MAG: hypothetical protein ABIN69_11880 [Aestuariivirga sp.]